MKVLLMDQGSPEWFEARRGRVTASRMDMILTAVKMQPSTQQETLIDELISERLSLLAPENVENFTNRAIRHGINTEDEARRYYTLNTGRAVQRVGICLSDDGRFGSSVDGLIGYRSDSVGEFSSAEGALELKCPLEGKVQLARLRKGVLDNDAKSQCHGHLIVTGLPWVDYYSYHPGLPPFLFRVTPDEFTARLREELGRFHKRYMSVLRTFQPVDPSEISETIFF